MTTPILFHFDFSSPYAYFASRHVEQVLARHNRPILWRPFLLGAAFKATGMAPLVQQPLRGPYAVHDWQRLARREGIPFVLRQDFPYASLAAGRAFYWLEHSDPALAKRFAATVFDAYFGHGREMTRAESVAEAAAELGIDRDALLAAVREETWKNRLKQATDEALAKGVFGAPTLEVDGELFWGSDRLAMVDEWLARGGW
jgi:2-hydroxychromene-2-carboxylate isomerase